jgi:monovalent cation:H+ antiporter-2, CPA2 family
LILGLVVIFGLIKFVIVLVELLVWGVHLRVATGVSLGLFEAGEFAFVIGGVALGLGVLDEISLSILSSVVIISMLIVPLMLGLEDFVYEVISFILAKFKISFSKTSGDLKRLPFVNHVVVFGHGRVGKLIAEKLRKKLHKDKLVVIDYDLNEVNKLVSEGVNCFFGDATEGEVLEVACLERARMVIVVLPDLKTTKQVICEVRRVNSKAYLMTRAHRHSQIEELKELGANRVVVVEESVGRLMYSYVKDRI